jgi:hypothetical protein
MGDSIDVGRSTAGDSYPPRLKTWATQYASIPIICNDMATQAWTMPPARTNRVLLGSRTFRVRDGAW